MTYEVFENAMKEALIWTSQTAEEKSETLHLLLHSFLTEETLSNPRQRRAERLISANKILWRYHYGYYV